MSERTQKSSGAARNSLIGAVFLEHQAFLKKFLSRFLVDPQDIDDVSQETYLRAYQAEQGQGVRSPKAFLFRIAKNVALNELTRKSRALTDYIGEASAQESLEDGLSLEQQVQGQEKMAVFCRAVSKLPPQCRRAFLMRKVYGFSHKEIGERLGISGSTVEKHVATGLYRCGVFLKDRGHGPDTVVSVANEGLDRRVTGE